MKHENVTEEIQETASLYALGALSQHEARAFKFHMDEGCEVCARELVRFERVLAGLGMGAPEVEPPAYIRDRLAARLEQEPQVSSCPASRTGRAKKCLAPRSTPTSHGSLPRRWLSLRWSLLLSIGGTRK